MVPIWCPFGAHLVAVDIIGIIGFQSGYKYLPIGIARKVKGSQSVPIDILIGITGCQPGYKYLPIRIARKVKGSQSVPIDILIGITGCQPGYKYLQIGIARKVKGFQLLALLTSSEYLDLEHN